MEVPRTADRSSMEIKDLLRNLHPDKGNHKDRIRRLNKFRNYVTPNVRLQFAGKERNRGILVFVGSIFVKCS
jgi:hypothetical protein